MERMQQDVLNTLDLTPDQRKQINDLNSDIARKVTALANDNKGTEGNKNVGAQRRLIMRGYDDKLESILTAEQWRRYREGMLAKLKELREKRADRLGSNNKPPQ
jgi:Spy/CpxP family protein refolding chaperone